MTTPELADVVIIGSGYGGAVAALRLSEASVDCVLLERGRRWPIRPDGHTFATPEHLDGRAAWLSTELPFLRARFTPFTGVLEAFPGEGVVCLAGAGVGGGSLVNNAVMVAPARNLFESSFGDILDYSEMTDVWYPRARSLIGVEPIPDDVLADGHYANAREFIQEAAEAGLPTQRPDMAVDWDIVRQEIAGTAVPAAIAGQHILGINSGAKRSVDRSILAAAEATGRVDVRILHLVRDIVADGDRYLVRTEQLDEHGQVLDRPQFTARVVFLAAGSLGTSRLLVRAKARGWLPALNEEVGRNWGTGGDHVVIRTGLPLPDPAQGGPAHVIATDWENADGAVTLLYFPLGLPIVGGLAREMLAVASPPPVGRFTYSAITDSAELHWPQKDARVTRLDRAVDTTAEKLQAIHPLTTVGVSTAALTSHSLGGAVLNRATGDDGELVGHPNLFVVDSALIPGSTGSVPPALTVTALADRCVTAAVKKITSSPAGRSA
jgi:cholesterol oxidase